MPKNKNQQHIKNSIGGQALIEGVMMRGPKVTAMAVRLPNQTISMEEWASPKNKQWYKKTPFIRGIFNFIDSMKEGYTCLMKSAEKAGLEEEEPSAFEKRLQEKLGEKYNTVFQIFVFSFSILLAVGLFVFLPTLLVKGLQGIIPNSLALTVIEGLAKIGLFCLYLFFISKMGDIYRMFQYHGAEHKTIFCYESGQELTVENVRRHSRFHPRCGTSFLVIVLILSIIVLSFISWESIWMRMGLKLLCLPIIMSLSYECIKFAGRHDNLFTKILSAPGLWIQRLTTKEPDDEMIEIAIAAMKAVIPDEAQR